MTNSVFCDIEKYIEKHIFAEGGAFVKLPSGSARKSDRDIEFIMQECEQYRQQLIKYSLQYFGCEYEYAEDCVQEAYVFLYESLKKGNEIKNCKSWLYAVTLNRKNSLIKEKVKRNEADFENNEEKDSVIKNALCYNPDFLNEIVTDEDINSACADILARLNQDEKKLYLLYYVQGKKLKDIATQTKVSYTAIRKRHEKLKKKLLKLIKETDI